MGTTGSSTDRETFHLLDDLREQLERRQAQDERIDRPGLARMLVRVLVWLAWRRLVRVLMLMLMLKILTVMVLFAVRVPRRRFGDGLRHRRDDVGEACHRRRGD